VPPSWIFWNLVAVNVKLTVVIKFTTLQKQ